MKIRFVENRVSRRRFLRGSAAMGTAALLGAPRISRAAARPIITHGIQSGDAAFDRAVLWSRTDRPANAIFEWATTDSFKDVTTLPKVAALPESDFTAKIMATGLPSDQDIFYRVKFQDLSDTTVESEPLVGHFRTAPTDLRDVSFTWSGDTCGQGWGIDEDRGGMKAYSTMLKHQPDFFIHSGDNIYADGVLQAEVKLPDGSTWKNIVTPEKSKPAETLDEFRGAYKYNFMDKNVLALYQQVPVYSQWDDHEVMNNWSDSKVIGDPYTEKSIALLSARAAQAYHEYMPIAALPEEPNRVYRKIAYGPLLDVFMLDMRSYRGPNGDNLETVEGGKAAFLGATQLAWLKRELVSSKALWKVIAADMPLGLVVVYDVDKKFGSEAVAQGDGPARGPKSVVEPLRAPGAGMDRAGYEFPERLEILEHGRVGIVVMCGGVVHVSGDPYRVANAGVLDECEQVGDLDLTAARRRPARSRLRSPRRSADRRR